MLAISSDHAAELMVDIVLVFAAIIFPLTVQTTVPNGQFRRRAGLRDAKFSPQGVFALCPQQMPDGSPRRDPDEGSLTL